MNNYEFVNKLNEKFSSFGVKDNIIKSTNEDVSLVINIEAEDGMPEYKLIISVYEDNYLSIYTGFKLDTLLSDEKISLIKKFNKINEQTFLSFHTDFKVLKISHNILEIDNDDIERVLKVVTIIPSEIFKFFNEIKKYLKYDK